ncbi:hypothetical protein FQN50_002443 [Emmonsiellopsis sp. PD_5]|nr:hypothetical protein FQN50_002443 [Emmonsiellopsis sp. PD_5]
MLLRPVPNIGLLVFAIFVTFSYVFAYDIKTKKEPQGPLKVALDRAFALSFGAPEDSNGPRSWLFTSHLTFKDDVEDIGDGILWGIALNATKEMEEERKQYEIGIRAVPNAMTILAWDKEIILASSMKGRLSFSYQQPTTSPVRQTLELCQMSWVSEYKDTKEEGHRTEAKCGEPMAAHLYYSSGPNLRLLNETNARIATWVRKAGDRPWERTNPCMEDEASEHRWGCTRFVKEEKLRVVDRGIHEEDYDLKKLAGGPVHIDQIQLCSMPEGT